MKLTTFILIVALTQLSAKGLAQKINLNATNTPLEKVLSSIETQTGYVFIYDGKKVQQQSVSIKLNNASIETTLQQLFKDLPFTYAAEGKNIMIKEKDPTFLERLASRWASIDVSGRVLDMEGKPLPGATVKVKATGKGVSTDVKGNFHLKNVEDGVVLIVSFIGYLPKEVNASANLGNIVLEQSLSKLDEIQVIAYGTTTQRLSTGNVTTIKSDVIEKQPVNNPLLALQGRVPGLFIEQATGFAGTGVKVRIQGENSLNNGNDPFYVIDGVPFVSQLLPSINPILGNSSGNGSQSFGNPLNFINPADIESIDVLKDADATAIYGSRAANGAILITTRKGSSGATKVDLNLQSGWGKVPNKLNLMNREQYLEMRKEALKNDGIFEPSTGPYGDSDLNGEWDINRKTDWQKSLIGGTSNYNDFQGSISGGSNIATYLIGGGYHKETGVFAGNYVDRKVSLHFNINNAANNKKFKFQFSGSYLNDDNKLPNRDMTTDALSYIPVAPSLYNSDGNVNWAPDDQGSSTFLRNTIGYLFNKYQIKANTLNSNLILGYQIFPGINFESSFGYNRLLVDNIFKQGLQLYTPEDLQYSTGRYTVFTNNDLNTWSVEPQLTINRSTNIGKISLLLGTSFSQKSSNQVGVLASGFSNDLVMDNILSAQSVKANSSIASLYKYNAIFGRFNYNWEDKYLLNLTARRDGSSRFGPANQFHNFGAIGLGWVFSEENYIKDNIPGLSFGKIRASYGSQGNDQINDYQFLSLYSPKQQQVPYQGIVIYQPLSLTNPYLQWEATTKMQVGFDLGFLKDRFLLNLNYYRNRSSNQLSGYTLPAITGFETVIKNLDCTIQNSGWEFMLSSTNVQNNNFSWKSGFNITFPKTLLVAYPDLEKSSESKTLFIGQSLRAIKVYHFLGVDPATGLYQFADRNGNPILEPNDPLDKTVIIDPLPKFYGGFQNTITYKAFQLDFLFQFTKQIANNEIAFGGINGITPGNYGFGMGNQPSSLLNRWTKPGDISVIQKYTTGDAGSQSLYLANRQSDAGWSDGSYVRLKNVSFSWQMPNSWVNKVHLRTCNLFVLGQNLLTITKYAGLDPETKNSSSLPVLRIMTLGIKVGL